MYGVEAEWQSLLETSVKCPLYRLKMSVPQGKIAIQPFFFDSNLTRSKAKKLLRFQPSWRRTVGVQAVTSSQQSQPVRAASTLRLGANYHLTCDHQKRPERWRKPFIFVSHHLGDDLQLRPRRELRCDLVLAT